MTSSPSGFLSQELQTHKVPISLFANNRRRVVEAMREKLSEAKAEQACVYQVRPPPFLFVDPAVAVLIWLFLGRVVVVFSLYSTRC